MTDQTTTHWTVSSGPVPDPSPPPLDGDFESAIEDHHIFWGQRTRQGHSITAKTSSSLSPSLDWQLQLSANWLSARDSRPFTLPEFPAHLLPFFCYKDAAVYVSEGSDNPVDLFDRIYKEWYPSRDREVFEKGILRGCGAPFFSSTMRMRFEEQPTPHPPALLESLVRWHTAFVSHLQDLIPRFDFLAESHTYARLLVRPGLTQEQLETLPTGRRRRIEYPPVLRRSFAECFVFVEPGWEDKGVRLVVLSEDMQNKILHGKCEGLRRDLELEEPTRKAVRLEAKKDGRESREEELHEHSEVEDVKVEHMHVWRGNLQDVMRAVLETEGRKRGLREYNPVLDEWLGEGENVGKVYGPSNEAS
ncbi:uncharacterized protein EI97DRAFT_467910 [Westerdykella ornata]|uniref:Uncharacterized protein n=1 Tax=Westerdykella ornata TaxID=318751 RepID=A0A6A6JGB8_WESOR|nr:uncharacterized protein EI97DRAFT_467910 [Westerdykella ornata]KAF2275315.1 hypothetical protein EI97DRAFT_467910 [Westerdykella ornata]